MYLEHRFLKVYLYKKERNYLLIYLFIALNRENGNWLKQEILWAKQKTSIASYLKFLRVP